MKKKLLLIVLILFPNVIIAFNDKVNVDGICYILDDSSLTASVTFTGDDEYNPQSNYSGEIEIPATINYNGYNYVVNEIGWQAFANCYNLTFVTLPNTIKRIGYSAFHGCI